MSSVVVAGAPRSGTTWVAGVLATGDTTSAIHEPDNDLNDSFALVAKSGIGRFPVLAPGELPDKYRQLWSAALAGGQPSNTPAARGGQVLLRTAPRPLIDAVLDQKGGLVPSIYRRAFGLLAQPRRRNLDAAANHSSVTKTVHASFSLEAIVDQWADVNVLIVRRNPLNAVGSWLELGWKPLRLWEEPAVQSAWMEPLNLQPPGDNASALTQMAWDYCVLDYALAKTAEDHPAWLVTTHETICADPVATYRDLFTTLGLEFTTEIENAIEASNSRGNGYKTTRVAADQIDRWKQRLTTEQVNHIEAAMSRFDTLTSPATM